MPTHSTGSSADAPAFAYALEFVFSSNRAIWFLCTSSGTSARGSRREVA
ncbi:hypothetical protein ACVWZ4_006629 [Bradyrhizobium sp. USDA 4472]